MAMASPNTAARRTRPPAPALTDDDDLVEEILFRIPPDDPRSLARAAAVCKRWRGLVADPAFLLRRTRSLADLHPAPPAPPPMLGFFYRRGSATRFMPTSSLPPHAATGYHHHTWRALDARDGRVLFLDAQARLVVSSPVTGEACKPLPTPWGLLPFHLSWNAALLCSAGADDFAVVLVGADEYMGINYTVACVYSSEDRRWSVTDRVEKPCQLSPRRRGTLAGRALYFRELCNNGILRYDLRLRELSSVVKLPPDCSRSSSVELMAAEEDGRRLGCAMVRDLNLYLWSMDESYCFGQRQIRWTQQRVIELRSLLPAPALSFSPCVLAVADGVGVAFVWAGGAGVFTVGLHSGQVSKVADGHIANVVPYVNPAVLQH